MRNEMRLQSCSQTHCYNPPANYKVLANGSTRWPTGRGSWPTGQPVENWLLVQGYSVGLGGFKIKHKSYQDDLRKRELFYCFPNDSCKSYEAMEEGLLSMLHASLIRRNSPGPKRKLRNTKKSDAHFPILHRWPMGWT